MRGANVGGGQGKTGYASGAAYRVTVVFTGGLLVGLSRTDVRTYPLTVGWECAKPVGGTSPYRVTECVRLR